jgi:DNA-binding NarL/FixJ family response regulator
MPEALQAVTDMDKALWQSNDTVTITQRNHSVAAALSAGWTEQDIARAVGVLPEDVARWLQAAI